jgi:hypothetical protein
MTDYSEYVINAQRLIKAIEESANRKDYKRAFEYTYHLGELADMLKESFVRKH